MLAAAVALVGAWMLAGVAVAILAVDRAGSRHRLSALGVLFVRKAVHAAMLLAMAGISIPNFVLASLLVLVLASWLLGDHHISRRGMGGLTLGILGMVILLWPKLTSSGSLGRRELWFSLSLLAGSFSWALGSVRYESELHNHAVVHTDGSVLPDVAYLTSAQLGRPA